MLFNKKNKIIKKIKGENKTADQKLLNTKQKVLSVQKKQIKVAQIAAFRWDWIERVSWILLSAIFSFISYRIFVLAIIPALRNISGGSSGIAMTIGQIFFQNPNIQTLIVFVVPAAFNLLIIPWAMKNLGKKFTLYTALLSIIQVALSLLTLFLPSVSSFFNSLQIFKTDATRLGNVDVDLYLRVLINAILGGLFLGFSCVCSYNAGACAGGFDYLSFYYSSKKGKPVSQITFIINFIVVFVGLTLIQIIAHPAYSKELVKVPKFVIFMIKLFGTILYVYCLSLVIEKYYPRQKLLQVTIVSPKIELVQFLLKTIEFQNSYTTIDAKGGFSKENKVYCHVVMNQFYYKKLIKTLNKIKHNEVFISSSRINEVIGRFKTLDLD